MYKLIIADDEKPIRTSLAAAVDWESYGFTIEAVMENGDDVIDYIKDNEVDVILTDINMPFSSGMDVARYVAQNNLPITIVFFSGHEEFEYARQALGYGVFDYLLKPTALEDIRGVFGRLKDSLDGRQGHKKKSISERLSAEDDEYLIRKVKMYINENYDKRLSLDNVASHVYLSPSYFSKLFSEKNNETFIEYLIRVRMENAKELLSDVRYKVYEVGEMVGYSNYRHFAKLFYKHTGLTPKEYRKNIRENGHD